MKIQDLIAADLKKECEIIIANFFDEERFWVHLNTNLILSSDDAKELTTQIERLKSGYPLEYITHKASFYSTIFYTNEGVLIPRPETEILVDEALNLIDEFQIKNIAEIGSGSGIIALMLGKLRPKVSIISGDINPKATALSKKNQQLHNVQNVEFVFSDLFENLGENIELLVSNPPYIQNDFELPHNVTYEPSNALFGGVVGDEILKAIIDGCVERKVRFLCCEMGYDQKANLEQYLQTKPVQKYKFYQDLSGLDRGFVVEFNHD